jgi:hypothetical protein
MASSLEKVFLKLLLQWFSTQLSGFFPELSEANQKRPNFTPNSVWGGTENNVFSSSLSRHTSETRFVRKTLVRQNFDRHLWQHKNLRMQLDNVDLHIETKFQSKLILCKNNFFQSTLEFDFSIILSNKLSSVPKLGIADDSICDVSSEGQTLKLVLKSILPSP